MRACVLDNARAYEFEELKRVSKIKTKFTTQICEEKVFVLWTLQLQTMFNCKVCQNLLRDPVSLPCGETVCKSHSEDANQIVTSVPWSIRYRIMASQATSLNWLISRKLNWLISRYAWYQFNDCRQLIREGRHWC